MNPTLKSYLDLIRAHFMFAWPLIFCSGLFLAFQNYGGFSWILLLKAILIGLFGFEGGMILNDYVVEILTKKKLNMINSRIIGDLLRRDPSHQEQYLQKMPLCYFYCFLPSQSL
jgi:hypothetical protein